MDEKGDKELMDSCRTVWLSVERDLNAKLHSPESLKHALQCSGRNPSGKTINHYWSKCGGSISFDQFTEIMQKEKRTTMADLMKAFRRIDLNGDGFISHDELFKVLTKKGEKLTHEEVQAIIDDADYNKDGKLDYAEFCHILLSTATECQAASKRKLARTLNKPSHHASKGPTAVEKENRRLTKMTSSAHMQDDRMHRENSSFTVADKRTTTSSKQATVVSAEDNTDNNTFIKSLRDAPALETRQSLSSKARQQKYGDLPLRDNSAYKRTQVNDNKSSAVKHNVTTKLENFVPGEDNIAIPSAVELKPLTDSSEVVKNNVLPLEDGKSREEVKGSVDMKSKPTESGSESEKEVEEDLDDESSNMGDSILQQLPISSTPATAHMGNSQPELTTETEQKGSQLFTSKLPAISKATLPPLSLPQAVTDASVTNTASLISSDNKTSIVTSTVTTVTTNATATTDCDKTVIEVKPSLEKETKPVGLVAEGVFKNGEDDVEQESSHSRLVTVTPLSHSLSSELSGTLSDDSMAVTPTESIDVTDSDNDAGSTNKTVEELLANKQPDHLKQQQQKQKQQQKGEQDTPTEQLEDKAKKQPPSSAVYQKPPKVPSNLESWYTISGKGCFYIKEIKDSRISDEQDYNIVCYQYGLSLPRSTCVFIEVQVVEPGDELCDVALFILKSDSPAGFITFTEHKVHKRFVCKLDLDAGNYTLVPFTTGCRLKPQDDNTGSHDPVSLLTADSSKLTPNCVEAITEIFHRIDLDDNGFISRQEFDLFQEHTSGEVCDDDAWQVIQDNFDQNSDDEITLKGFLDLHLMTAQDTSGGKETELLNILQAMGYNNELTLDEACPFSFNVHTETCEGEIVVMEMQPFASLINSILCQLAIMRGVANPVKGEEASEQVTLYTYNSLCHTSTVIENEKERKVSVQLDCSDSVNFLYNRESCVQVLEVPPKSSVLGFHLMPNNPKEEWKPVCHAELILTQ